MDHCFMEELPPTDGQVRLARKPPSGVCEHMSLLLIVKLFIFLSGVKGLIIFLKHG